MRAMAALSKPQAFRLDAIVEETRTAARQRFGDRVAGGRRTVAEQAPAAARAAHLRRRGPGAGRAFDEVIDGGRRHAWRQALPVVPLLRDLVADFVPITLGQRIAHRRGRVADPLEA